MKRLVGHLQMKGKWNGEALVPTFTAWCFDLFVWFRLTISCSLYCYGKQFREISRTKVVTPDMARILAVDSAKA